jgi:hypothetical protein
LFIGGKRWPNGICLILYVVTDQSHVVWYGIPNVSFNNGCDLESETPVIFTSKNISTY